jgi:hypothetical protein
MALQWKNRLDMPHTNSLTPDISTVEEGSPAEKSRPNVVNWDNEDDPQNPVNWKTFRKRKNLAVISAMSVAT